MTFHFEKIGPVDSADLALGDLTIIAGHNNTGKTYLAYALYGFLKGWRGWPGADVFFGSRTRADDRPAKALRVPRLVRMLAESHRASVHVTPEALTEVRRTLIDQLAHDFSISALPAVFSSTDEAFDDARISVSLGQQASDDEYPTYVETSVHPIGRLQLRYDGSELAIALDPETASMDGFRTSLRPAVHRLLFAFVSPEFYNPFILSAERFGISLFYKELDFTKSQLVDLLQKMGRDDNQDSRAPFLLIDKNTSRYSQPIKDNIDYTRNIHDLQKRKGPLAREKLFDDIKDIMGGYYKASRDVIIFKSKARGKRRFDIPLHLASSSARGLADLYFYLRYKANQGDLLIIDEPESHLDTRNQILLARVLARFIRAGIKVLITTHSDYIIKEINNLIMLSQLDVNNGTMKELGYAESDQLAPTAVRAYMAKDHKLVPAIVDELGLDMPVFDETIDDINQVSVRLADEVRALDDGE